MRISTTLLVLALAACSPPSEGVSVPGPERIPDALAVLTLCEEDPTITPVVYAHRRHLESANERRPMRCVECHHDVADDPKAIPRRCEACHPHEADTHDDTMPADI